MPQKSSLYLAEIEPIQFETFLEEVFFIHLFLCLDKLRWAIIGLMLAREKILFFAKRPQLTVLLAYVMDDAIYLIHLSAKHNLVVSSEQLHSFRKYLGANRTLYDKQIERLLQYTE